MMPALGMFYGHNCLCLGFDVEPGFGFASAMPDLGFSALGLTFSGWAS